MSAGPLVARPAVLSDLIATTRVRQAALVAGYAGAIALASQVRVPLPVGPVPLTLQTLAVLLGAAVLGPRRAVLGAALYVGVGVAGVPWFAVSGGATSGYLVGFVVAAALVGAGARAGRDRSLRSTALLMLLGNLVIWTLGAAGLVLVVGLSVPAALAAGVVPFLFGDALKLVVATSLLPAAWHLVDVADDRR